jgi:hypothetical protein
MRKNPDAAPRDPARADAADVARAHAASEAARAQRRGLSGFASLEAEISAMADGPVLDPASTGAALPELSEAELLMKDRADVCRDINKYISKGLVTDADAEDFDLLRWWQVCRIVDIFIHPMLTRTQANGRDYPILYRLALDVLPMQASAVPMERVFSSAKESTRLRRANLAPSMMGMLQVLKFGFRQDRLNFMASYISTEKELVDAEFAAPATKAAFEAALKAHDVDDILSYLDD